MAKRSVFFGNVNKAQVAIRFANYPLFNLTAEALGDNMVTVASTGEITSMLPTATGFVGSPNASLQRTVSFSIVKTNPLAQLILDKIKVDSNIGDIEVTTDSTTLAKQTFENAFFQNYYTFSFNGKEPSMGFTITCFETINNSIFGV